MIAKSVRGQSARRVSAPARFAKISDAGNELPPAAPDWAAVLDSETKLIWTRGDVPGGRVNWKAAQKKAAAVDLCGFEDWRLPTRKELLSLVDDTRHDPAIDTEFFTCQSSWYWTSTPAACSPADYAWIVHFTNGYSSWYAQSDDCFVRAVRSSQ